MACFHHVGDIGTIFEFVLRDCDGGLVDLTAGVVATMHLRDPAGNVTPHVAVRVGTGVEGRVRFTSTTAVLDEAGPWRRWVTAVMTGGATFTSTPVDFYVHDNSGAA